MSYAAHMQLNSNVQILRICTFVGTVEPSRPGRSASTASHQHFRAGLRQNSNSFCAVASCDEFTFTPDIACGCVFASTGLAVFASADAAGCEMPVFSSTNAMLVMQHRPGSIDLYPHSSSRSKPLQPLI